MLLLLLGMGAAAATWEMYERHQLWRIAREYCNEVGKPLLRVGMQRTFLEPPNGDVTIDIDPAVLSIEGGVLGDERAMPFADKQFGATLNEHTLEHLESLEDVQMAASECVRVADHAVFLAPSTWNLASHMFNPTHYLLLNFDSANNRIYVVPNTWRTGFGYNTGPERQPALGQYMISTVAPEVIVWENPP